MKNKMFLNKHKINWKYKINDKRYVFQRSKQRILDFPFQAVRKIEQQWIEEIYIINALPIYHCLTEADRVKKMSAYFYTCLYIDTLGVVK